jgi:DNA-binding beta-propeller fold protein YncE
MNRLMRKRSLWVGMALLAIVATMAAQNRSTVRAPRFEVNPLWPKPLPNHWVLGSVVGISIDTRDQIWIIHRNNSVSPVERGATLTPPAGECCAPAPPVLVFDVEGNLVKHWGGPSDKYEWPASNHAITADSLGNVWIAGNGGPDSHVLRFDRDGTFLKQYGRSGARQGRPDAQGQPTFVPDSHDPTSFGRVAKIFVDAKTSEAYIADGYLNRRVAVVDIESGKMKRYWGAYGNKPDDVTNVRYNPDAPPSQQFGNRWDGDQPSTSVHCADMSNDRLVYVCDRPNNRIQVFKPDGTFVKEAVIAKRTLGEGSVWDLAFSRDAGQRYIYLADGRNMKVHILRRDTLEVLTSFGDGGRQPGQFVGVHSVAVDSSGNVYTTETYEGKRIQKFVLKGEENVRSDNQGVVWPTLRPRPR